MRKTLITLLGCLALASCGDKASESWSVSTEELSKYKEICRESIYRDAHGMYREAGNAPGSEQYADILWDWDSWLSDVALRQIILDKQDGAEAREPVLNKGFQNWNYLVLNMIAWLDGRPVSQEF